jgi:tetratricopeptide (TPR) repeat protein
MLAAGKLNRSSIARLLSVVLFVFAVEGCRTNHDTGIAAGASGTPDPCALALAPVQGGDAITRDISLLQARVKKRDPAGRALAQLGWKFIEKARISYDPGCYTLAEQCAACIEKRNQSRGDSLLLRGHALHSLHRFREAEEIARNLVSTRGLAVDYGLLGDVLFDQGRLDPAIDAYQKMIDLKPCLESYSRGAQIRWLKGDLEGALELMMMAARAGGPQQAEPTAWAYSRVALYELQIGNRALALDACEAALDIQPDYAQALLVRGRVRLANQETNEAVESFTRAAQLNPLPEYQWALAEALRASSRETEATSVELRIKARGAQTDPRTYALYLATRGENVEEAINLAQREILTRKDVFTLDALAWSLVSVGRISEARSWSRQALEEGTKDARLFYHAGVIAARAGQPAEARRWLRRSASIAQMLLPSEKEGLASELAALKQTPNDEDS